MLIIGDKRFLNLEEAVRYLMNQREAGAGFNIAGVAATTAGVVDPKEGFIYGIGQEGDYEYHLYNSGRFWSMGNFKGPTGQTGLTGNDGATGEKGKQGKQGIKGNDGAIGAGVGTIDNLDLSTGEAAVSYVDGIVTIHNAGDINYNGVQNEVITTDFEIPIEGKDGIIIEADSTGKKIEVGIDSETLAGKQDKLTAGDNITIDEDNVISASGGGSTPTVTKNYIIPVDFNIQPTIDGALNSEFNDYNSDVWTTTMAYRVILKDATGADLPANQFKLSPVMSSDYTYAINQIFTLPNRNTGNSAYVLHDYDIVQFSQISADRATFKMCLPISGLRYSLPNNFNNLKITFYQVSPYGGTGWDLFNGGISATQGWNIMPIISSGSSYRGYHQIGQIQTNVTTADRLAIIAKITVDIRRSDNILYIDYNGCATRIVLNASMTDIVNNIGAAVYDTTSLTNIKYTTSSNGGASRGFVYLNGSYYITEIS